MKEKVYWHGYVYAYGIKKRCRKTDRHQFDIGKFSIDTDSQKMIDNAKFEVTSKMKTIIKDPELRLSYMVESGNMVTWEPFSGRDQSFIIGGLV